MPVRFVRYTYGCGKQCARRPANPSRSESRASNNPANSANPQPFPKIFWLRGRLSGAGAAAFGRTIAAVGVDIERPGCPLDDLLRDHALLDPTQARQVEHGVEQDALHDRAQTACAGLAVYRLARNRPESLFGEGQVDRFHLEQPLVLLDQRILRLDQ